MIPTSRIVFADVLQQNERQHRWIRQAGVEDVSHIRSRQLQWEPRLPKRREWVPSNHLYNHQMQENEIAHQSKSMRVTELFFALALTQALALKQVCSHFQSMRKTAV